MLMGAGAKAAADAARATIAAADFMVLDVGCILCVAEDSFSFVDGFK